MNAGRIDQAVMPPTMHYCNNQQNTYHTVSARTCELDSLITTIFVMEIIIIIVITIIINNNNKNNSIKLSTDYSCISL